MLRTQTPAAEPSSASPQRSHYDVVIVGGAMLGASVAWFLASNPDFDGTVLVVERDPSYRHCSTAHSNSCMRQQFSTAINVQVSQFAAAYIKDFRANMGADPRVPDLSIQNFGYLYLASEPDMAQSLRDSHAVQAACGAGTELLQPERLAARFPFYRLDDVLLASYNNRDEGYFDGTTVFDWWRRLARARGVEFVHDEVVAMTLDRAGGQIERVSLRSGASIGCAAVVNAAGPRAAQLAAMAGVALPVEPRKRYTFVFDAQHPLPQPLPLTIDPSGVHVRSDGAYYMAGCPPDTDPAVDSDDFEPDHDLWLQKVWPAIAQRIPQFEAIKLLRSWVGHYAYNRFDQNAIVGTHPERPNFYFANGFSGHGLQQAPAVGRGVAELISYGEYRSLDLTPFAFERVLGSQTNREKAVI